MLSCSSDVHSFSYLFQPSSLELPAFTFHPPICTSCCHSVMKPRFESTTLSFVCCLILSYISHQSISLLLVLLLVFSQFAVFLECIACQLKGRPLYVLCVMVLVTQVGNVMRLRFKVKLPIFSLY